MSRRIEVDPIKCDAHGQCAELFPERITLDEWGYPLIDDAPIPASLEGLARRTVRACPTLALNLVSQTTHSPPVSHAQPSPILAPNDRFGTLRDVVHEPAADARRQR